jgi:protein TonB
MRSIAYLVSTLLFALSGCATPNSPGEQRAGAPMKTAQAEAPSVGDGYSPPVLLSGNAPIYPLSRLLKGTGGEAVIEFTILEDGTTADFAVVSTDYEYYANHAIIAVKEWRFKPAMKNGKPVVRRVRQVFSFTGNS